jgi:hypothetical protein
METSNVEYLIKENRRLRDLNYFLTIKNAYLTTLVHYFIGQNNFINLIFACLVDCSANINIMNMFHGFESTLNNMIKIIESIAPKEDVARLKEQRMAFKNLFASIESSDTPSPTLLYVNSMQKFKPILKMQIEELCKKNGIEEHYVACIINNARLLGSLLKILTNKFAIFSYNPLKIDINNVVASVEKHVESELENKFVRIEECKEFFFDPRIYVKEFIAHYCGDQENFKNLFLLFQETLSKVINIDLIRGDKFGTVSNQIIIFSKNFAICQAQLWCLKVEPIVRVQKFIHSPFFERVTEW